ncbi:MAG TPA: hypothetical protein VFO73_07265 [Candidatus Limnocylindrales bacterium]|nr:hypothetical protein [Candidatus Limnocylindrales bacterium]
MFRRAAAVFLVLHGLIHLMGFAVSWQLATMQELAYRTTVFNGALDVGDVGARVLGIAWLLAAAGLVAAGVLVWRGSSSAAVVTTVAVAFSIVVCLAGLPDAFRGLYIDVALVAGLIAVGYRRTGAVRMSLR